ncbi:ATP-dependent nuclease [Aliarcobacter lanthieri]|uniref:ATP-dependent nuclease n=1 Tax=Aliarcobacter lanthieri TaxID=1355374 RepID=UPI000551C91D|nr:AAA family ATPase [Aliarcobacter lanthieri]QKF59080.1 ATP-dependent endonuclease [Aliarcobacter lanthieri]
MIFKNIKVENFKGLKDISSPLSKFTCIIGENNAGKSTFIQALLLFIKGTKLTKEDFFDTSKDILISVEIDNIREKDLELIDETHREKFKSNILFDADGKGSIKLARRYSKTDYSSKLRNIKFIPKDKRFNKSDIDELLKGKKGNEIPIVLAKNYPELDEEKILNVKTLTKAKELINNYISTLNDDEMEEKDISLDTGINNSITSFFPEPIYIPAVKDLSDDMKTKDSASFGKLLNILLDVIEDDLSEAKGVFDELRKKLSKTYDKEGNLNPDNRLEKVKQIEETIQKNLNQTFKNVSIDLEVPPPEIKSILSNANIIANDGVIGPIQNKGDGFKRAITFSILRSYVELANSEDWQKDKDNFKEKDRFLFLFEEPELYLHPKAQNILFEALSKISNDHQMIVSTHSPLFFSSDETKTFIKIKKIDDAVKSYSKVSHIDLTDMSKKDQFQLISFETSNHAFFSDKVVLVEGDTELIVLPHISKTLNSKYDFKNNSISLVKINGKGSFKRYKDFFKKFDLNIYFVADLDVLLDGFEKLEPSEEIKKIHSDLLSLINEKVSNVEIQPLATRKYKDKLSKSISKSIYEQIKDARSIDDKEKVLELLDELFSFEQKKAELLVLQDKKNEFQDVVSKKRELLKLLRKNNIFVLEAGDIESYYPKEIARDDKPTQGQNYCELIDSKEKLFKEYSIIDEDKIEFELIFEQIFA